MITLKNIPKCPKCLSGNLFLSGKLFLMLILLPMFSFSQDGVPYAKGKVKHRLSIGGIKSFYYNPPEHTTNTKALAGFNAAYNSEILSGRRYNLLLGLEYQNTGLRFQGYYKKPGFTYVYDKTFAYTHEIRIQEVDLPLSVKVSFNIEKEHPVSPYFIGGIGARYIFAAYTVITNDSTGVSPYDAKDKIDFENQRVMKGLSAFYHAGLGLQYNYRNSGRALFFEFQYKYSISRFHYDGDDNSNNLNIRDAHLVFSLGMRL